ncbi:MAG: hypothetical protein ACRCYZ_02050, partial [Alphaproteobacteria bacterium]
RSIESQLSDPTTPQRNKGELYDELMTIKRREEILNTKKAEYEEIYNRREAEANMLRLADINKTMISKYPDWGNKSAEVGAYIGKLGMDNSAFLKAANPALVETIIKAMKFDKVYGEKEAAVTKKAGLRKPKPVTSKSSKSAPKKTLSKNERIARQKALRGELSPAEMFALLED